MFYWLVEQNIKAVKKDQLKKLIIISLMDILHLFMGKIWAIFDLKIGVTNNSDDSMYWCEMLTKNDVTFFCTTSQLEMVSFDQALLGEVCCCMGMCPHTQKHQKCDYIVLLLNSLCLTKVCAFSHVTIKQMAVIDY